MTHNESLNQEPAIGIIGGSGLYEMAELQVEAQHDLQTPYGAPSGVIIEGKLSGRRVCFLARHGAGHRLLAHEINHRANVWALRSINVRWAVSITAVGSLREDYKPRDVVVPDQLGDRTGKGDEQTFFGRGIAAHIGFADPYSHEMRRVLLLAAQQHEANVHDGGAYLCMNGPAFSTRAEAKMHRMLGFDIIGMTNAPEAKLCREAEIALATLALVTDYDCWKTDEAPVDVASVIANLHANSALARRIVQGVVPLITSTPDLPEHRSLDTAILTPRDHWPENRRQEMLPLLARFG